MAEWGGYSLLDEALKLQMAGQAQGFAGGTPTLTGIPNPGTAIPAIPQELMARPKPEATFSEKFAKGVQDIAPLMAQIGTSFMRGRNTVTGAPTETVGSQIGSALTGALGTMKMNEAMKKMLAQQLSGGGVGEGAGFTEGQPLGLSSAETVGLSPEQVSGLYGTAINLRSAELKRPFENMQALSDSYLKIMTGEAKPAEMEAHLAAAQKTYQELAAAPVKNMVELMAKVQGMEKVQTEMAEINAKIAAMPTETKKKEAETEKTKKETAKTEAETKKLGLEIDPTYTAFKKRLETEYGTKLEEVRRGDKVTLTNPITGKAVMTYDVGAPPESATKKATEELPLKKFAMQRIAPLVVRQLEAEMATTPKGKQSVDLQNLISSLRGYTGEIDPGVLLAKSSPELQDKFNKLMDIYIKTPGLSETEFGSIVQGMIGTKGATVPTGKSGEGKPVTEKYKPGATAITPPTAEQITKQLVGKKPGTYESNNYTIEWDGRTPVSIKPKSKGSTVPPNPFGTF